MCVYILLYSGCRVAFPVLCRLPLRLPRELYGQGPPNPENAYLSASVFRYHMSEHSTRAALSSVLFCKPLTAITQVCFSYQMIHLRSQNKSRLISLWLISSPLGFIFVPSLYQSVRYLNTHTQAACCTLVLSSFYSFWYICWPLKRPWLKTTFSSERCISDMAVN